MLDFGETFNADIELESEAVRELKTSAEALITDMLPDTAINLELWESQYGIFADALSSIEERRAIVISAMRARGGLSIPYFEQLAESFGYTIGFESSAKWLMIQDGIYTPFRAGISKAGDKVYSSAGGSEAYTWGVYGTDVEQDTVLIELFETLKTFGTQIIFTNA